MPLRPPLKAVAVAASVMAADSACLGKEITAAEIAGADAFHWDIMDGHFVPNLTFGPAVVRDLRAVTALPFDVHLMVAPVAPFLDAFAQAGADSLIIHVEPDGDCAAELAKIRALGKKAGLALNPETPVAALLPFLDALDIILVMTVSPGFGGQALQQGALEKFAQLRAMIGTRPIVLGADGGINAATIAQVVTAGADQVIVGSGLYGGRHGHDLSDNMGALRRAMDGALSASSRVPA